MTKKFRPVTPSQRMLVLTSNNQLTRSNADNKQTAVPQKNLLVMRMGTGGRNHHGHITCRHKGSGHRRFYRLVDFKRDKENIPAQVASIEYDPNRTAHIALLHYV